MLGYDSTGCGFQAAACVTLPGVTGSDLTSTGSGALAQGLFRPYPDSVGTSFTFSLTGFTGNLETLTFGEYNNDCEINGVPQCTDGSVWAVQESLNGAAFSSISTFGSGGPAFAEKTFSVSLNQDLVASDTAAFRLLVTSLDTNSVPSSALAFDNINLNTADSAPEPASWALFGSGLLGVVGVLRRRARPTHGEATNR